MKAYKSITILILVLCFVLSIVKAEPTLECPTEPIDQNYVFNYQADGYKKAEIQIGYDEDFDKNTYNKLKPGEPISKIYKKILKDIYLIENGKFYARVYAKGKKTEDYSNICEFELDSIQVLDGSDWEIDGYSISSEKAYNSKNSLKVPYSYIGKNYYHEIMGPYIVGTELSNPTFDIGGAKISMDVYTPGKCDGYTKSNKNFLQIQYRGTKLFRKSKWYTVETYLSNPTHSIVLKIGTWGNCKGDFYIDNIKIEKDGKIAIWNFE